MHKSVKDYVQKWSTELELTSPDKTIVEFGSLDENGTVRDMFKGKYVGVDMREGKGVDMVHNTNDTSWLYWELPETDCVLWLETMEHDLLFWETINTAWSILKEGGYLIVTTRGIGFPLHNFPKDYYRFTVDVFTQLFEHYAFAAIHITQDPQKDHPGVFGVFKK